MNKVDKFWMLLEKSTLTSGVLSVLLVGSVCYLAIVGKPIPDLLTVSTGTIMGFFFGVKVEASYRIRQLRGE